MSIVTGVMRVRCNTCKKIHTIDADDAEFEHESNDNMPQGIQKGYRWETTIECSCGNNIEITYDVYEYPEGVFNCDNVEIEGGTLIEKYDYDFQETPDEDDF